MRNNKMKGFTLVELLVVIAILAILATVSVVGYTSYIESTTIKVDEDLAAQLNNFLAAVKADYDGEYFEELSKNGVTANNVVEITNYILSTGGVDSLTPKSADYGYHFYFDLVDQKYMLIGDKDERINGQSRFGMLINGLSSTQTAHPELAVGKDNRYFLVETGTDLADLIAEFKAITSAEELNTYFDKVSAYENDAKQKLVGLIALVNETVFTTNNGHFIVSGTENHKHLFVQNDLVVSNKNNHEKMSVNGSAIITKDAPLVTLQKDQTIVLSLADDVTLAKHSFWFADGSKATLVIEGINTLEELITRVDVDFTNANIVVGGKTYTVTGVTFKDAEGNTVTDESGEPLKIDEKNKVTSFSYTVSNEKSGKVDLNNGFIAIDGGTFTLSADNFTGLLNNEVSTKEVKWTIASAYYYTLDADNKQVKNEYTPAQIAEFISTPANGQNSSFTITIGNSVPMLDGIVIKANSVIGTDTSAQTITLKVLRATGVTGLTLGGNAITFGNELNVYNGTETTVNNVTTTSNTPYTLNTNYTLIYNYSDSTSVTLNDIAPVMSGAATSSFDFTNNGKTLTLKSSKTELLDAEDITVTFGKYFSNTFKISMYDALNLTFLKDNDKVVVVGDENPITIGELIKLNPIDKDEDGKSDFSVPANAEIWFMKNFSNTYAKPGAIEAKGMATGYIASTQMDLKDGKDWSTTSIQFVNTKGATTKDEAAAAAISVVIVVPEGNGYRCISQPRSVVLVDGTNVRTYEEMVTKMNSASTGVNDGYPLTSSIVFLADITMNSTNNFFTIPAGKTVYGNTFDLDIKNGRLAEEGIINLKGRIQDVRILGKTYPNFASSAGDEYGSSAINATGTAYIYNCYISNTRSPLRTSGTTTIEDTVLFGGRYSNINMTGGSITIVGTVTTIQQVYSVAANDNAGTAASNVIGIGISGWFNDGKKIVNISKGANLVQYNFMNEKVKKHLPTIKVGTVEVLDLKLPFDTIFNGKNEDGSLKYAANIYYENPDDTTSTKYVNTGIVGSDKYMLDYDVSGADLSWEYQFPLGNNYYPAGYEKTVKLETNVADDEEFIVVHDSRFVPQEGTKITNSSVKLTGAQLKAGVIFKTSAKISFGALADDDGSDYWFHVQSDAYKTVNVDGSDAYNGVSYEYADDLSGKMSTVDGLLDALGKPTTMHGKGLHYGKMVVDVNTPKSTATAVGEYTYQDILDQYIEMGGYYTPESFEFNSNGTLTNYWETLTQE